MSRRSTSIAVVSVVLGVVALIGYAWPTPDPKLPVNPLPERVLFANSAGKVVFDHKKHFETYKVECQSCHHEREKATPTTASCRSCHGAVEKADFRTAHPTAFRSQMSCVTCHHMEFAGVDWNHEQHGEMFAPDKCATCHHNDKRSQPKQQKCATCHGLQADGNKPSISAAAHARCGTADCHAKDFLADGNLKQCRTCHNVFETRSTLRVKGWIKVSPNYQNCAVCHVDEAIDDLVPGRMAAFHASCIGCHEQSGKGPFGQDKCNQCHTK